MQIDVRLVEDSEEGVRRKFVEEIEQCQSRDAYAIFEHIDVLLFVEDKLFIDSVEEGYDISVIIPHEKVMHRLHPVESFGVRDQARFVEVSTTAVTRAMIISVSIRCSISKNRAIRNINFKRSRLSCENMTKF